MFRVPWKHDSGEEKENNRLTACFTDEGRSETIHCESAGNCLQWALELLVESYFKLLYQTTDDGSYSASINQYTLMGTAARRCCSSKRQQQLLKEKLAGAVSLPDWTLHNQIPKSHLATAALTSCIDMYWSILPFLIYILNRNFTFWLSSVFFLF